MKFTARDKAASKNEGPGLYVRLKDGESINLIPRGEIYEFYSVFGTRGEVLESTPGAKLRFKVNVVVNDSGTLKAKVLEFGMTVYEQLAELNKVCDVTKTKIRFSRRGVGKSDTTYMLLPLVNEPLTPQVLAAVERIPLNEFEKKPQAPAAQVSDFNDFGPPVMAPDSEETLPF